MPPEAPHTTRPVIRPLDPLLINQIAAGEVIERPASVVKELVENALDAGAARITIDLEAGGTELIRVTDDGRGILPDELPLALAPHATSKIQVAEDLDRIATKGFRGEALASIASIAKVRIRSRVPGTDEAWSITAEGGPADTPKPASGPVGTSIEVRQLFFNTPARRKFLRTHNTERGRCLDWIRDLAMAHPAVGFRLAHDGRTTLDLPADQSPRDRVLDLLGRELAAELLEVEVDRFDDARGILIWGLVGRPSVARPTNKAQHVFLSGRAIRDKTVQHALREAYRGLIEPGRHPTAVLMIEMAPDAVDVNVHPAKLEVRFRDQSLVHKAVYTGVRDALQRADLTRSVAEAPNFNAAPSFGPANTDRSAELFVERVRAMREEAERALRPVPTADEIREAIMRADRPQPDPNASPEADGDPPIIASRPLAPATPLPPATRADRFLQVRDSYLLVEDEHGLLIVDQHALHERVMFETLLARINDNGALESQRLLTPAVAHADPDHIDRLADLAPLLERIGLEAAPLGPRSVGVSAFPSLLFERGVDPVTFTTDLLARAGDDGFTPSSEAALHEVLDMMACKAAVKAGDHLTDPEIAHLLESRERVERSAACPHGRPTSVRITLTQLEKLFERR